MELWVAVLSGVLALLGGWVGAHLALQRFKSERAFDRRVQWYELVADGIYLVHVRAVDALAELAGSPERRMLPAIKAVQDAHDQLAEAVFRGDLFALGNSARALQDIRKANAAWYGALGGKDLGLSDDRTAATAATHAFIRDLDWARRRLAHDLRGELGYEPMPHLLEPERG